MIDFVTLTSQGQISIPARFRKKFGLLSSQKLVIEARNGEIVLRPSTDLVTHAGILHDKALSEVSLEKVLLLEDEGIQEAQIDRYISKKQKNK